MAATPAFKPALTPQGTPYYTPTRQPIYTPPSKRLEDMTETEALIHFEDLRARLLKKQKREREYLDRRAARGTHTPTDEAYEADQLLEDELIELLDRAIKSAPH